jgi:cytochrome oxidase Cu insertion factor (SCO1/SenC/PrrC family)
MQNEKQLTELAMQSKGRKVFMLMVVFFVVPVIVVILMYQFNWKPNGNSLGELVNPPRLLSEPKELTDDQGIVLSDQFWKTKWSVVYVAAECEQVCLNKLHDLRQLHVSLYKDIERTQRVLITNTQDVTKIKHDYPDLIVINKPETNVSNLVQEFQIKAENPMASNRIYLVDSLGYLMMSYPASFPLADVRKDIIRLLRYSWAG